MIYRCNPGPITLRHRDGSYHHFEPKGSPRRFGAHRQNPGDWEADKPPEVWAARLFVGFNIGTEPTYTLDDLTKITKTVREDQTGKSDSSFIAQKGLYWHEGLGETVEENSGQVIIFWGPSKREPSPGVFTANMERLADIIGARMYQESIILEVQRNGVTQAAVWVLPPKEVLASVMDRDEIEDRIRRFPVSIRVKR